MLRYRGRSSLSERGQVVVLFALLIPMLLAMSAFVIGIGNWYVHAKHLQTKADAGAIAGGGSFEFPCRAGIDAIDQRIASVARQYAGPASAPPVASTNPGYNPQVGGVGTPNIHAVLNGPRWYDDDGNGGDIAPSENLDICSEAIPMRLDVKVTEDNSFPLASLIPLFPDIKRKAVIEIQEAEGVGGLLPIAVRAPEPTTVMAIFYNEANGAILDRKYLIKATGFAPTGLQGWSTENPADPNAQGWASVPVQGKTGVVIGVAYRGACNTWDPTLYPSGPPAGIVIESSNACFEDGLGPGATTFANIGQLCNQNGSVQIVNCYYADPTTTFPNEVVQAGLHFIRGYVGGGSPGTNPPELRSAFLSPGICSTGSGSGYFSSFPAQCNATLSANFDIGSCHRVPMAPPASGWIGPCVNPIAVPTATETRIADNVEVKYTVVSGTGNNDDSCDFGASCDLGDSGSGAGYGASGPVTVEDPGGGQDRTLYAFGLLIRLKNTFVPSNPNCSDNNFSPRCEWYFTGTTRNPTQPNNSLFFNDPVQRAFRGDTVTAGSIRFLRLKADRNMCTSPVPADEYAYGGEEGSHPASATSCFVVELGMKGNVTNDADEEPVLFSDGIGSSQLGYLDCTATGPQNIVWELMNGCPPLYAPNNFNTNPYCPSAANLFTTPNPGAPFDNGDWPPLRCVKTRPTSQGSDLIKGLNGRIFDPTNPNPSPNPPSTCPPQVGTGYTQGRNYWKHNSSTNPEFGFAEDDGSWDTHFDPTDPRVSYIFLTTPESFTGSGQNSYPVVGAIAIYITGFGTVSGRRGTVTIDDPCAEPLPSDVDLSGGSGGGRVIWGHIINRTVLSANATSTGDPCNPAASPQLCVPVLVE